MYAMLSPSLQHATVLGDLVLPLFGCEQIVRIYVLQSNEYARDAGSGCLFDEIGNLVAKRINLDGEACCKALLLSHPYQPIEETFPILVAGKIIIRDHECLDALGQILADDLLKIISSSKATLATLDIDNGTEGALIWAATP